MNKHEICEELKEKGFPQDVGLTIKDIDWDTIPIKGDMVYVPILEEMLEWLGDRFTKLVHSDKGFWVACYWQDAKTITEEIYKQGETPWEAIALLCLEVK